MKKKNHLQQLQEKEKKIHSQLRNVRDEIEEISNKIKLPVLRKKYEGKYFKYHNGTSNENCWPLYSHCKKVISVHFAIANQFETPTNSFHGFQFQINKETSYTLFETEITKEEYDKAAICFFIDCKQLLK